MYNLACLTDLDSCWDVPRFHLRTRYYATMLPDEASVEDMHDCDSTNTWPVNACAQDSHSTQRADNNHDSKCSTPEDVTI